MFRVSKHRVEREKFAELYKVPRSRWAKFTLAELQFLLENIQKLKESVDIAGIPIKVYERRYGLGAQDLLQLRVDNAYYASTLNKLEKLIRTKSKLDALVEIDIATKRLNKRTKDVLKLLANGYSAQQAGIVVGAMFPDTHSHVILKLSKEWIRVERRKAKREVSV